MSVIVAGYRQGAIAGRPPRDHARGLIPDVSLHIRIDRVLARRDKISKSGAKLLPIRGGINFFERHAHAQAKDRPFQRDLPPFAGLWGANDCTMPMLCRSYLEAEFGRRELSDHGAMPRGQHVKPDIRRTFHVDNFRSNFRPLPSARSLIFALRIKVFDKNVFHVRAEVSEPPGNAAVVPHDHEGQAGKRYPGHVKIACRQMRLVPNVGNLMAQMHVVGEQRPAADGVRSRKHPII